MPRFRLDATVRRFGPTMIGGSPLKLFRLTGGGVATVDAIAAGDDVTGSRLTDALLDAGAIHPCPGDRAVHDVADVTVIVPALGTPAHVPPDAVLVDDGSRPPITGAAVRLPANRGPAAARNAGLAGVTTPLVAFVDTDVRVPPGWLDGLLPHLADPRVALVAPRVRSRPASGLLARWERRHSPLDLGPDPALVRAGGRVAYVPAAAVVCRTDAVRAIGGFDESLRYGEDVDLVWRLDAAGWRCRYEPAVEVEHEPRPDWRSWARQRVAYGSSAARLTRRHRRALAPFRSSGWSVAVWTLAALGHPALAGGVAAGTGVALARRLPDLPFRAAFGLAVTGHGHAGGQLATAIRRAWWPIFALAAIRSRRVRRVLGAALIAAGHPLRLADDLAYSTGVWRGVVRERTMWPLRPQLTTWPGRRTPTTARPQPLPSSG